MCGPRVGRPLEVVIRHSEMLRTGCLHPIYRTVRLGPVAGNQALLSQQLRAVDTLYGVQGKPGSGFYANGEKTKS